jgi:hypothetical protein
VVVKFFQKPANAGVYRFFILEFCPKCPGGKVDFLQVNPICFSEFLSAADPKLFSYLESIPEKG